MKSWIAVGPALACGMTLVACEPRAVKAIEAKPAHVEAIAGSELHKVTLSQRASERLDIKTSLVQEIRQAGLGGARIKFVPYGAVLYDAHGGTWVYTNPEPLVFVRHRIQIDYISGDRAVLSHGPPLGTAVVTVGAAELFGAEFEIGH